MCLNEGQNHAYYTDNSFLLSLCRNDPVSNCCEQTMSAREMEILETQKSWLTDEIIINAAMLRFSKALKFDSKVEKGPAEKGPVIISPFFFVPLLASLVKDTTATTRIAKETTMMVVMTSFASDIRKAGFYGTIETSSAARTGFLPLSIIQTIPTGSLSLCIREAKLCLSTTLVVMS